MSKKPLLPRVIQPKLLLDSPRLIVYELFMFRQSCEMPKNQGVFLRSLVFEGVVLHARVLRDFFYKKLDKNGELVALKNDDIFAADFLSQASSWPYTYDDMCQYLKETRTRMDRTLAHLSYDRLKYVGKEKAWDLDALRKDFGDRWFELIGKLRSEGASSVSGFLQSAAKYSVPIAPPL